MIGNDHSSRLLIVDDTPENVDILGELLSDYKRSFALNGKKAVEKAKSPNKPDLILLDVMMPELDGFQVCEQLKADPETANIPIIFVTALGEETDEAKGFKLGAVDYISKPYRPSVVRARVKTQLELKHSREALAAQNDILETKVTERTQQLREALYKLKESSLETIVRLSKAAEYKDDDTGSHVLRMSRYSAAIAKELGHSSEEVELLLHAAPMHDVGKIGIPDRVLLKPGKLTEEEWQIMRRHCKMGSDILLDSESEVIRLAQVVAMSHHEKWDGTGYPRQLKETHIPISGRIVAVADVFDALTSRRPYKEPFPLDKSFSIIKEGKGQHFDPDVVDAFFNVESEILEIKGKYQNDDESFLRSITAI